MLESHTTLAGRTGGFYGCGGCPQSSCKVSPQASNKSALLLEIWTAYGPDTSLGGIPLF